MKQVELFRMPTPVLRDGHGATVTCLAIRHYENSFYLSPVMESIFAYPLHIDPFLSLDEGRVLPTVNSFVKLRTVID